MIRCFLYVLVGAVAIELAITSAMAAPTTYQYSGGPLVSSPGVPSGLTNVTATFSVDLAPNLTFASPLITDWSFSDGYTTVTSFDGTHTITESLFTTDNTGAIILAALRINGFGTVGGQNIALGFRASNSSANSGSFSGYCFGAVGDPCQGSVFARAEGGTASETLSTPVSEPSPLALVGLGLAALGLARRKRGTEPTRLSATFERV